MILPASIHSINTGNMFFMTNPSEREEDKLIKYLVSKEIIVHALLPFLPFNSDWQNPERR